VLKFKKNPDPLALAGARSRRRELPAMAPPLHCQFNLPNLNGKNLLDVSRGASGSDALQLVAKLNITTTNLEVAYY
jgi:hypothetical protein